MSEKNKKYGVNPEVLKRLEFTERDKELTKATPNILIQGIIATPPEQWDEDQLWKAKALKINKWTYEQLRYYCDHETGVD